MSMREKIARAMAAKDSGPEGSALFDIHWQEFQDGYLAGADAALDALAEPTRDMLTAFVDAETDFETARIRYIAAIKAAKDGA
jgi:hypothetical protein